MLRSFKVVQAIFLATKADMGVGVSDAIKDERASLHFVKMHGLGNDFVMITDQILSALLAPSEVSLDGAALKRFCSKLARLVCDRHIGIGGDGLIVAIDLGQIQPRPVGSKSDNFSEALDQMTASYPGRDHCDVAWLYVNSDGSYSDMCGNGLRCLTAFVIDLGWISQERAITEGFNIATAVYPVGSSICVDTNNDTADTLEGGKKIGFNSSVFKSAMIVRTRLAGPRFGSVEIPLALDQVVFEDTAGSARSDAFIDRTIRVRGQSLQVTCVSMGNPHCVVFAQDACGIAEAMAVYARDIKAAHDQGLSLQKFPAALVALAEDIQNLSLFPQGTNVEFVSAESPEQALVFVVERGCGPTLACASGAAAVLAAGVKTKRLNKKSYVILPGGKLEASLSLVREQEYIDLTGPAVQVFTGDFALPANFAGFGDILEDDLKVDLNGASA